MNLNSIRILAAPALSLTTFLAFGQTLDSPNIVWHNKATGQNELWVVQNGIYQSTVALASNNFLRALLAVPDFGLATMWKNPNSGTPWRLDALGIGEPIGMALRRIGMNDANTLAASRFLTVLGDPTLRMHIIQPPSNPNGTFNPGDNSVELNWQPGDGERFLVYRAALSEGPFGRLTTDPIVATTYTDESPLAGTNYYLIRGLRKVATASGSYDTISQGTFIAVNGN